MRTADPHGHSVIRQLAMVVLVAVLAGCSKTTPPPDTSQVAADTRRLIEGTVTVFDVPVDPSLHQTEIASVSPPLQVKEAPPTYEFRVEAYAVLTDPKRIRPEQDMRSLQDVFALQQWVRSGGPLLEPGAAIPYEVVLLYQQDETGNRLVRHEVRASKRLTRRPLASKATAPAVAHRSEPSQSPAAAAERPASIPKIAPTPPSEAEAPAEVPDLPSPEASTTPSQGAMATETTTHAPSFDCGKATTPVERAICDDHILSALDADMGDAYVDARRRADAAGRVDLRNEQRQWIRNRNRRCGEPVDVECLREALAARRDALQNWRSKDAALISVEALEGQVPTVPMQGPVAPICQEDLRDPQSVEEQQAADAGWLQLAPLRRSGSLALLTAVSSLDGSCRPQGEVLLAFSQGRAIARIEPAEPARQRIRTITDIPGDQLRLVLDVWAVDAPRCCPTGEETVEVDLRPYVAAVD